LAQRLAGQGPGRRVDRQPAAQYDTTLAILRREGSSREEKLRAIERAFEAEPAMQGERDEDAEAEEARDRERLS
jgi:hypothetical protein